MLFDFLAQASSPGIEDVVVTWKHLIAAASPLVILVTTACGYLIRMLRSLDSKIDALGIAAKEGRSDLWKATRKNSRRVMRLNIAAGIDPGDDDE